MVERRVLKSEPTADLVTVAPVNGSEPPTFAQVQAEIAAAMAAGELSLPEKFAWFEKKLRAALSDSSTTASELAKLLTETDNAVIAAQQQAAVAREAAHDPSTDLSQARAAMEDAQFLVGRQESQVPRLQQRYQATALKEQVQTYCTQLAELAPERDALAQELHDTYQEATDKLIGLFTRVREFEQRARQRLGSPPANCEVLERIDVRVVDKVVLPDLNHPDQNIWPPPANFAAACVQSMVPQHPGAAWCSPEYLEALREERVVEQERMARHYAESAKAQEIRQNEEERARFAARQQQGG